MSVLRNRAALALMAGLLIATASPAGTWKVGRDPGDCDGPCNFHDQSVGGEIGGGIERAMRSPSVLAGDTVMVWPGSLPGGYTIKVPMKSGVVLIAKGYPDSVVLINGSAGSEPAIRWTGTSELTEVVGFHITWDAGSSGLGGGIAAYVASGTIRDNVFLGCRAGVGAAIYLQGCDVVVRNNLFLDNQCMAGGGVVAVSGGGPTIENNTFAGSAAPYGAEGSAIYGAGTSFLVERNILYDSRGASAIYCGGGNTGSIACNLFWANELGAFGGGCPDSVGTSGNFIADPLFCSSGPDAFALCADSPALAASCDTTRTIGYQSPFGTCTACGGPTSVAAALLPASWGRVKAAYR